MGWAAKMANVSFNRKRAKLKQVLGIRARLALLAVILVAPLMLERIRSLEDTRRSQIAQAAAEFNIVARHSADAQREVSSSVETILNSEAFIRASAGESLAETGAGTSARAAKARLRRRSMARNLAHIASGATGFSSAC